MQKELDGLGIDPAPLQEDKTLEDSVAEADDADNLDPDSGLDKTDTSDEDEEGKPPVKVPNQDVIRQAAIARAQRRGNKIRQLEETVSKLATSVEAFLNKDKVVEANNEIEQYANKYNLNPEGIKGLVDMIEKKIGVQNRIEKPVEYQAEHAPEYDEVEQREVFEGEWDELLPKIEEQYPHASASQIREAQKLMNEVAHSSPQLAEYDLEDILNSPKYSQRFKDLLFNPKRKTFEAGRTVERGKLEEDVDLENANINSPRKALAAQKALFRATGGDGTRIHDPKSNQYSDLN